MKENTQAVYNLIDQEKNNYDEIILLGYSNGADLLINLLKTYENIPVTYTLCLHPKAHDMSEGFKQQTTTVIITTGIRDEYLKNSELYRYNELLQDQQINSHLHLFNSGHQITRNERKQLERILNNE